MSNSRYSHEANMAIRHHMSKSAHHDMAATAHGVSPENRKTHRKAMGHHEAAESAFYQAKKAYDTHDTNLGHSRMEQAKEHAKTAEAHSALIKEDLNEISAARADKYIDHAENDASTREYENPKTDHEHRTFKRKQRNRGRGLNRAYSKLGSGPKAKVMATEEVDLNEALVAKIAGVAAKLAAGHQFGDVAQQGAEYAVHRGEQILRDKLSTIKKGAAKLMSRKQAVHEMVGSIEQESNKKHARGDGGQHGPDPEVQRELKNHGVLYRAARMKAAAERKLKEETIDELHGKGSIDAIGKYHSERMTQGKPDSKYHAIMRNRAKRLKDIRDGTGPLGKTTMKNRMEFATADSKEAKALKPK